MKVATCLAAPTLWVDAQNKAPQKKGITFEDSVNGTEIYKTPEFKEQILERHHEVKQKEPDKLKKRSTETSVVRSAMNESQT